MLTQTTAIIEMGMPTAAPDTGVEAIQQTRGPQLLVADMDGSLLLTDALHESLVLLLFRQPWKLPGLLLHLFRGRAFFKRALANVISPDIDSLPVNEPLLAWLRARRADGHRILLYSASDQLLVDKVGKRFGIFEEVLGSDGSTNLSGVNKYHAIAGKHGAEFTYIGDSVADLAVWSRCGSAVLVGGVAGLRSRLAPEVEVLAEFASKPTSLGTWRRALRLHQWAKNALIFVPLLLSGLLFDLGSVLHALQAFVAFGLTASATYLANDLYDLPSDRRHQTKRRRPLASGELALRDGLVAIPVLLLASLAVMSTLPWLFGEVVLLYMAVTLAYSIALKRKPILDVIVLAGLFTLRLVAGIVLLGTALSPWLLAFSMFFFGALATIKRYTECQALLKEGHKNIHGRGYRPEDASWLMSMGTACGFASILVFFIYLVDALTQNGQFPHPGWMWAICPILAYWIGRIWLLAVRGEMREDPIEFAIKDRLSLALGLLIVCLVALAVF